MKENELLDMMRRIFLKRIGNKNFVKEICENEISEKICVEIVCGPAYTDFTPRTIHGVKKEDIQDDILKPLAKAIFNQIGNGIKSQEEYDKWHMEICKHFLEKFETKTHKRIKAGKAQKIVNMTFKYLYCCNNASDNRVFRFCHMPLDTYTLEWFCRDIVKNQSSIRVSEIKKISWSNLEYGSLDEVYTYMWIQNEIRKYLNGKRTPLKEEFFVWPEQQMRSAIKYIRNQTFLDEEYPYYSTELYEELEILASVINRALNRQC